MQTLSKRRLRPSLHWQSQEAWHCHCRWDEEVDCLQFRPVSHNCSHQTSIDTVVLALGCCCFHSLHLARVFSFTNLLPVFHGSTCRDLSPKPGTAGPVTSGPRNPWATILEILNPWATFISEILNPAEILDYAKNQMEMEILTWYTWLDSIHPIEKESSYSTLKQLRTNAYGIIIIAIWTLC